MERYTWWQVLAAWVTGIVVGVVAMTIFWAWSAQKAEEEARPNAGFKEADAFVHALRMGDTASAYAMTAPVYQKQVSKVEFERFCSKIGQSPRFWHERLTQGYALDSRERPREFTFHNPDSSRAEFRITVVSTSAGWKVRVSELFENAIADFPTSPPSD